MPPTHAVLFIFLRLHLPIFTLPFGRGSGAQPSLRRRHIPDDSLKREEGRPVPDGSPRGRVGFDGLTAPGGANTSHHNGEREVTTTTRRANLHRHIRRETPLPSVALRGVARYSSGVREGGGSPRLRVGEPRVTPGGSQGRGHSAGDESYPVNTPLGVVSTLSGLRH